MAETFRSAKAALPVSTEGARWGASPLTPQRLTEKDSLLGLLKLDLNEENCLLLRNNVFLLGLPLPRNKSLQLSGCQVFCPLQNLFVSYILGVYSLL